MRLPLIGTQSRIALLVIAGALTSGGFIMAEASAATKSNGPSNGTASGQSLTEAQARAIIAPWYSLFNVPGRGDVRATAEEVLTADFQSCWGNQPGECWGRETAIKVIGNFAHTIPDMRFEIVEVLVAGDRVIVRGEQTGTPAGELFGAPHTGKSFRTMAFDIHTIKDGKIAKTFHMENWLGALDQLRAKEGSAQQQPYKGLR